MGKTAKMTSQGKTTAKRAKKKPTRKKRVKKKAAAKKKVSTKKKSTKKAAPKKKSAKKRATRKKAAKKTATRTVQEPTVAPAAVLPVAPPTAVAATPPAPPPPAKAPPLVAPAPARMMPSTTLTPQPRSAAGAERREHERYDVPGLIEVEIEMFGYQRDEREFGVGPAPAAAGKINSFGATVNLSLGGMLAEIADPITPGSHCLVRFTNAGVALRPELRWGVVLRCGALESGRFEIAVTFDNPLEVLDIDSIVAA